MTEQTAVFVEGEYVVGVGIFLNCNDSGTLKPMLENMYSYNTEMKTKNLTADSGYESEENYTSEKGVLLRVTAPSNPTVAEKIYMN